MNFYKLKMKGRKERKGKFDEPCEDMKKIHRCDNLDHNHSFDCNRLYPDAGQIDYPTQIFDLYPDLDVNDPRIRGIAWTKHYAKDGNTKINKINYGYYIGTVHDWGACRLTECYCPPSKRIYGFRIFYKDERYTKRDMKDNVNGVYKTFYNEEENEEDKQFCKENSKM